MNPNEITVVVADLTRRDHQDVTLQLLNGYASDPLGDGQPLSDFARLHVLPGLREHPTTSILLAFRGTEPVGLAICFLGFSTFMARPLLNIHDFFVEPAHRGSGVSRKLMAGVEQHARDLGCCKITLEVLERNHRARGVYAAAGFSNPSGAPDAGATYFLSKIL